MLIQTVHLKSNDRNLIETVHDGPFHRNRRSKWSYGYAQLAYIKRCSSTIVSILRGFRLIDPSKPFLSWISHL